MGLQCIKASRTNRSASGSCRSASTLDWPPGTYTASYSTEASVCRLPSIFMASPESVFKVPRCGAINLTIAPSAMRASFMAFKSAALAPSATSTATCRVLIPCLPGWFSMLSAGELPTSSRAGFDWYRAGSASAGTPRFSWTSFEEGKSRPSPFATRLARV